MGTPRLDILDRNFLMNGAFDFAQRNLSSLVGNGSSEYVLDRWLCFTGFDGQPASSTTYSREQDSYNAKTKYSLKSTGSYVPTETIAYVQRIESKFARMLVNNPVSFLGRFKTDGLTTVKIRFKTPAIEDDFSSLLTLVDEKIITVTDDLNWNDLLFENVTMPSDVNRGLQVEIICVSTITGVAQGFLSQIKLSIGVKAQEFSLAGRDYKDELQLCQRYFEKSYDLDTAPGTVTSVGTCLWTAPSADDSAAHSTIQYTVRKRTIAIPRAYSDVSGTIDRIVRWAGSTDVTVANYFSTGEIGFRPYAGMPNGVPVRCHWTADAEL